LTALHKRCRNALPWTSQAFASRLFILVTALICGCSGLGQGNNNNPPAPAISNLSPLSAGVGSLVTISGANFGATQGSSTVSFNGTAATPTSWSGSSIVATVPRGATTGNVVVAVAGMVSNGMLFTVTSASVPNITNLNPTSGAVGSSVSISGSNFGATQGSSTVTFNGTAATATSWSATSVVVPVPTGATTGNVVVTVGGVASNGVLFTVTSASTPNISSLNPTSGATGTAVTISGSNFGSTRGSSTATFNGTAGTPTSWSATSIVMPVPSGATTGNVVVTVGGVASNGVLFTVTSTSTPNISSLNPTSAAVGTSVTISGANFGATQGSSTVTFNGTAATPTSWSATSIVAPVPSGATTGNVVVTVGGAASNAVLFTVTSASTMGPLVPAGTGQPGSNYFVVKGTTGPGIMLNGSHAWSDYQDQGNNGATVAVDFNGFVSFLTAHSHNATILQRQDLFRFCNWGAGGTWIVSSDANNSPWARPGPGTASDGLPKFDLTQFNAAYFTLLHARVLQLQNAGIYAIIELFDGHDLLNYRCGTTSPNGDGYPGTGVNNINSVDDGYTSGSSGGNSMVGAVLPWQQAYMQKVVDTVNDLQNVLYEPCKEAPDATWCQNMISAIHTYESTKPNQHPVLFPVTSALNTTTVLDSNGDLFAGSSKVAPTNNCGSGTPACKVDLNDSDHSYTMPGIKTDGPLLNRNFVWENFVSGAGGIMFQDPWNMFWSSSSRNLCNGGVAPTNGICPSNSLDLYWEPLRNNLGYATLLSQKLDLVKMSPCSVASTGWCLADASATGSEFVIYAPNGGSFTVNLSAQAGRTLNYQWLDPTSGSYTSIASITGGNSAQSFTPPWGSAYDAVLYIVDAAGHN
jgi:IPT/TIG domain/Putative collagen-binding domain of a collagenase